MATVPADLEQVTTLPTTGITSGQTTGHIADHIKISRALQAVNAGWTGLSAVGHAHAVADLSDTTDITRTFMKSATVAAARTAIGAQPVGDYATLVSGKVPAAQLPTTTTAAATTSTQGAVRLAGDLGGTADAPTVPGVLRFFEGTAAQIAAKITADGGRRVGYLYIERPTPVGTNYATPVNQRLTAGTLSDASLVGPGTSTATLAGSVIDGAGAVTATAQSGVASSFGVRARFAMGANKPLKVGATIRRNITWSQTPVLLRVRFLAADGATVLSTVNGPAGVLSTTGADYVQTIDGVTSPANAAFAEIDVVSNAVTPATNSAITARAYVLEDAA